MTLAKRSRSGSNVTEAQRAARGVASVKLRFQKSQSKARLEQLALEEGLSKSALVETWIERAWDELESIKADR